MSVLDRQIQRWNRFFSVFGLRPACRNPNRARLIIHFLTQPVLYILLASPLLVLQLSNVNPRSITFDEGDVNTFVHVISVFVVVSYVVLAFANVRNSSKIQARLLRLEANGTFHDSAKVFVVLPVLSFAVFISADIVQGILADSKHEGFADAQSAASEYLLEVYTVLHVTQFSVHLFWLKGLNALLNEQLREVLNLQGDANQGEPTRTSKTNDAYIIQLSSSNQSTPSRMPRCDVRVQAEVRFARSFHVELYDLSLGINKAFATRNLIAVSYNFIVGIVFLNEAMGDLIAYFRGKLRAEDGGEISLEHIMFHMKWSVSSFISIYGLIWASRKTASETHSTMTIVYELFTRCSNQTVKKELRGFALQLLQNEMKFSPHDFFTFNHKLFLSILGTFVSYLIVLIQFRIPVQSN